MGSISAHEDIPGKKKVYWNPMITRKRDREKNISEKNQSKSDTKARASLTFRSNVRGKENGKGNGTPPATPTCRLKPITGMGEKEWKMTNPRCFYSS